VAVAGPKSHADLELLQGVWASIAGWREAKLLIAGARFAFEFTDGDVYMGTFDLDPEATPKRMEMRVDEGPSAHRGQVARCIYHVEGDVLRWCTTRPGSEWRLTRFPSVDDDCFLSLVFKRARPSRAR